MSELANSIISQLRAYDQALKDWLTGFPSRDNGDEIDVVMSTPDRAFASMKRLMETRGARSADIPIRNIPLPFISVYRVGTNFDPARNRGYSKVNLGTDSSGNVVQMKHPLPFTFDYRVEFWAKNQQTLSILQQYASLGFTSGFERFLPVDLSAGGYYSDLQTPIVNNGTIFTGVEEPEENHRVLREVLNIQMRGWLFNPLGSVAQIEQIIIDYCDDTSGEEVLIDQSIIPDPE